MDEKSNYIVNRLDFIEFRQNLIFLKPPQHSTQLFYELKLEDFLKIKEFTKEFSNKIKAGESLTLNDFEKKLIETWKPAKSYPLSANLIAKVLMEKDIYEKCL